MIRVRKHEDMPITDKNFEAFEEESVRPEGGESIMGSIPLWKPRYTCDDGNEMAALPLLFWLIKEFDPHHVYQFGLNKGAALLGICQAINKIESKAKVTAYLRKGEVLSGDQQQELDEFNFNSIDFQYLVEGKISPDNCSKPLLIASHAADLDFIRDWMPEFRSGAMVFIRLPASSDNSRKVMSFCELLDEPWQKFTLARKTQIIEVLHIGADIPKKVMLMASGRADARGAHSLFQRLADGLHQQALAIKRLRSLEAANSLLQKNEHHLEKLNGELAAALDSEARELSKIAELQARIFDCEQVINACLREKNAVREQLEISLQYADRLAVNLSDRDTLLGRHENTLADMSEQVEFLTIDQSMKDKHVRQGQLDARFLTEKAEVAFIERDSAIEELNITKAELAKVRQVEDDQHKVIAGLENALSSSTSELEVSSIEAAIAREAVLQKQIEIKVLTDKCQLADQQIDRLNRELAILHDIIKNKDGEIARFEGLVSEYEKVMAAASEDLERCNVALNNAHESNARKQKEIKFLTQASESLRSRDEAISAEVEQVVTLLRGFNPRIQENAGLALLVQETVSQYQAKIEEFQKSTSWKVTKPIRYFKQALVRLKVF